LVKRGEDGINTSAMEEIGERRKKKEEEKRRRKRGSS